MKHSYYKKNLLILLALFINLPICLADIPYSMKDDIFRPDEKQLNYERQLGYETPMVLSIKDILPNNRSKTSIYNIEDTVYNDGFLNHYTIDTKWGKFYAGGTEKLKIRLNEIIAIDAMKKISTSDALVESAKKSGKEILLAPVDAIKTVGNAILDPSETAKKAAKIPMGVVDFFSGIGSKVKNGFYSAKEDINKPTSKNNFSNSIVNKSVDFAQDFIGYNDNVRNIEKHYKIIPDSDNEILHNEIRRLARLQTSVSFSSNFIPSIPMFNEISTINGAIGLVDKVSIYEDKVIQEKKVHDELLAIGLSENDIRKFQATPALTTSMRTKVTNAILKLPQVKNRYSPIKLACNIKTYETAWIFVQIMNVLPKLNQQYKFTSFLPEMPLPALINAKGQLIIPLMSDALFWTETLANISNGVYNIAKKQPNIKSITYVVSGTISQRTISELNKLGIKTSYLSKL